MPGAAPGGAAAGPDGARTRPGEVFAPPSVEASASPLAAPTAPEPVHRRGATDWEPEDDQTRSPAAPADPTGVGPAPAYGAAGAAPAYGAAPYADPGYQAPAYAAPAYAGAAAYAGGPYAAQDDYIDQSDWSPARAAYASAGRYQAPAAKPAGASSGRLLQVWGIVIGCLVLLGFIEGFALHQSIRMFASSLQTISAREYEQIKPGMTLDQVTALVGESGTQVQEPTTPAGGVAYRWTNPNSSYATVVFVNGLATSASESGLEHTASVSSTLLLQTAWSAVALLMVVAYFLIWGASLYSAALLRGYRITVVQIVLIAVVTSLLTLIPFAGALIALLVMFAMIQWWIAADFVETLIVVLVSAALRFVAFIPIGVGAWLALAIFH